MTEITRATVFWVAIAMVFVGTALHVGLMTIGSLILFGLAIAWVLEYLMEMD